MGYQLSMTVLYFSIRFLVRSADSKKAISLLKKYCISPDGTPSEAEKEAAIKTGVLVQDSMMTHDEILKND